MAREDDEIVCEDVGAHAAAERSEGTIQTPTHLEDALEGRDGALDPGAKALQRPEGGMMFPRPLGFGARAFLRDRDVRDAALEISQSMGWNGDWHELYAAPPGSLDAILGAEDGRPLSAATG